MPGVSAAKAFQTNANKYDLNYSRFDKIGSREAKRDERDKALSKLPPALRERLGDSGAEMALQMAEKMKKNPELMPSPEELKAQLDAADWSPEATAALKKEKFGGGASASLPPVSPLRAKTKSFNVADSDLQPEASPLTQARNRRHHPAKVETENAVEEANTMSQISDFEQRLAQFA